MQEKIKALKQENKNLFKLLKDSEKVFYQKLTEAKKESQNLTNLFKQLWPLIKSKVKDPSLLIKTITSIGGGGGQDFQEEVNFQADQQSQMVAEFEAKINAFKVKE